MFRFHNSQHLNRKEAVTGAKEQNGNTALSALNAKRYSIVNEQWFKLPRSGLVQLLIIQKKFCIALVIVDFYRILQGVGKFNNVKRLMGFLCLPLDLRGVAFSLV